jgi:hypothetical protein
MRPVDACARFWARCGQLGSNWNPCRRPCRLRPKLNGRTNKFGWWCSSQALWQAARQVRTPRTSNLPSVPAPGAEAGWREGSCPRCGATVFLRAHPQAARLPRRPVLSQGPPPTPHGLEFGGGRATYQCAGNLLAALSAYDAVWHGDAAHGSVSPNHPLNRYATSESSPVPLQLRA